MLMGWVCAAEQMVMREWINKVQLSWHWQVSAL
jgi:hypothetical protein